MNSCDPGSGVPEHEATARPAPACMRDPNAAAAYPAELVQTWPAHKAGRYNEPPCVQAALDAAAKATREDGRRKMRTGVVLIGHDHGRNGGAGR